jgi:hypothetical protein
MSTIQNGARSNKFILTFLKVSRTANKSLVADSTCVSRASATDERARSRGPVNHLTDPQPGALIISLAVSAGRCFKHILETRFIVCCRLARWYPGAFKD